MAQKTGKPRCSCCGLDAEDFNKEMVCIDCQNGLHQKHCGKPMGEVPPESTPKPSEAAAPQPEPPPAAPIVLPPAMAAVLAPQVVEQNGQAGAEQRLARRIDTGRQGLILADLGDMYRFATMVVKAGMAPKGFNTPEAVCVAFQFGAEVGLTPMQALQNVYNVGNRPALFGDAPKALVETSGLMEDFDEWYVHKGERVEGWPQEPEPASSAVCFSKRIGRRPKTTVYTWADAKKAGLISKEGPWHDNPGRQMMFRARGFNLRDNFPDVLKGFKDEHEVRDTPVDEPEPAVKMPVSA